jgi:hypothetical protein
MLPQQQLLPSREGRWWMTTAFKWCSARGGAPGNEPPAQWTAGSPFPGLVVAAINLLLPAAPLFPALCPSAALFLSIALFPLV